MSGSENEPDEAPPPGASGEGAPRAPVPEESPRFHRRGFFTEGLRQLLRPLADMVEERLERVGIPTNDYDGGPVGVEGTWARRFAPDVERTVLRPPGAVPEGEFLERCLGSGQCVNVCPASAIVLARSDDPAFDEKPVIDPSTQACVVCEDLSCMHACPSGALMPLAREEIRMGLAEVDVEACLRSRGEDCRICADKCPLGEAAIELDPDDGSILVKGSGCVGCGVCEMYCPARPQAIRVRPERDGTRSGESISGEGVSGEGVSGEGVSGEGGEPGPDGTWPMGYADDGIDDPMR